MSAAVLLTCHGTVSRTEDVPAYLAAIRHGRPTPPEVVAEVQKRLDAIGGSPLMRITDAQAAALAKRLAIPVHVGARHWHPYPKEVVPELVARGVRRIVSLPLAPQYVDVYHALVRDAVAAHPDVELVCVTRWGLEPAFVDACVETVDEVLDTFAPDRRADVAIVLSAHSLPQRVIDAGDPYERDVRALADSVAAPFLRRGHVARVAFQSQGMTSDAWLGPDLATTFRELAASGVRELVVSPIGFVADHVETLYDLDIEARHLAEVAGFSRFERAPTMNARRRFIDALEAVARRALAQPGVR